MAIKKATKKAAPKALVLTTIPCHQPKRAAPQGAASFATLPTGGCNA